jgi:glycosyltransferase involved in cell wall biosynthesis
MDRQSRPHSSQSDSAGIIAAVTPAYNEEHNLGEVAASMFSQTLKPITWIIVDDGSSDGTFALARKLAESRAWVTLIKKERDVGIHDASFKAFEFGVSNLKSDWKYLMKLDADTKLPPSFLEKVVEKFESEETLGIASGVCAGEPGVSSHPRGNNRVYRRECWEHVRFPESGLGWDTVDEVFARLNGWQTKAFSDLVCAHMRSKLPDAKYRFHQGRLSRYLGYYWWFVLGRSAKMLSHSGIRPSLAYLGGHLKGGLGSADERTKQAVRMDQRNRIARIMRLE